MFEYDLLAKMFTEKSIENRYVTNTHILPILEKLNVNFSVKVEGNSVLGEPIYSVKFGNGKIKIFIWSQMHGNESTCTKAILDLFILLSSSTEEAKYISENYTLYIVPIANPDGAKLYTRENANKVDLNRDAKNITQPESKILRSIANLFQPNFCFNMHDQRTIFGVGNTKQTATVSFLAPSYNIKREIKSVREKAMQVIIEMNLALQKIMPNAVARFDDSFNENCIGDYLMTQNIPTVLFEAGHFAEDYQREKTRKFIFFALLVALHKISENDIVNKNNSLYFDIPENKKSFCDIYYKNVKIIDNGIEKIINFVAQYEEVLKEDKICFVAKTFLEMEHCPVFGHLEYDLKKELFISEFGNKPRNGEVANFTLANGKIFINGILKQ